MTREELIDQAYRQVQSELAGTPQSGTMGQALIDPRRLRSANSKRAEITGTPMNNSLSNSPNTPTQLLELFKELIKKITHKIVNGIEKFSNAINLSKVTKYNSFNIKLLSKLINK